MKAIPTIAKYKAKEAIRTLSGQYSKRSFLGILLFIVLVYGGQFVWIYLVLPGVAKGGGLETSLAKLIISSLLWFFLAMNVVSGAMGGGMGIQDKDAYWIFTTGITTNQYVWGHTLEYGFFALLFTAPLMFVPAVTLFAINCSIAYMVLFPVGLIMFILMMDSLASLITIGLKKGRKTVPIIVYSSLIVLTLLIITSPLVNNHYIDLLIEALPTTLLARVLIGSMVGSFECVPLLTSGIITLALILLVSWASIGYEYEYKSKIAKEKRYARKRMKDPLTSKNLLLIKRRKAYISPIVTAVFYIVIGIFLPGESVIPIFACFLMLFPSQALAQQILLNERMWILKSLGLSGNRVVSSMLKVLIPISIVYLPLAAILLVIGGADLWLLPGIFSIAIMIPPYIIWTCLKFKKVGVMLSSFGAMAAVIPALVLPALTPYYVSAPACILIGILFYYTFFRLASNKWDEIWEEIDFAARFGQKAQNA